MAKHRGPTRFHLSHTGGSQAVAARSQELQARLAQAEETLRAIQTGEVDAVVVHGPLGEQVFTLKGAEYAYRVLVEAMNEGAAAVSADGIVLYCNNRIVSMVQIPQARVIGHPVRALIATSDLEPFNSLFVRALSAGSCKAEILFQVADGSTMPAYVSLSRLPAENDPAAVCMVVTDLREHKQRDEMIAAGNLARSILQHAAEPIAVCDPDGRIILANEALRKLCGVDPLYQHFDDVVPLELSEGSSERQPGRFSVKEALKSDVLRAEEVVYRRFAANWRESRVCWLLLTAGPLKSGDQVLGCVLAMMDITHRKLAETALLRAEKLAATGHLAASIAHEINNPLAAVLNLLYLIENASSLEQVRDHAKIALREVVRISHITKQTLSFYRGAVTPEKVAIAGLLDEVVEVFAKELTKHNIVCKKRYEVRGEVLAYAGELRQVFSNLLRNSIEATGKEGHLRLHVRGTHRNGSDGVAVFISDDGPGIRPEIRDRIFDPFFTTKGTKGTGLGLWVAKDLVQKHRGSITVRSNLSPAGHGSCFYVFIPTATRT